MIPFQTPYNASSNLANIGPLSRDRKTPGSVLSPKPPLSSPAVKLNPTEVTNDPEEEETVKEEPLPEGIIQFYEEDINDYCIGGYHSVRLGDTFNKKYEVVRKIGFGKFSTIWLAVDTTVERPVALKILKANSYGIESDIREQETLKYVKSDDPGHVIGLLDHFVHHGPNGRHVCLVFGKLGPGQPRMVVDMESMGGALSR